MQPVDFLDQLLDIRKPWQVLNVLVNQPSKRVDIYIGFGEPEKKGLFGFSLKSDFLGGNKRLSCPYCQTALPRNGEFETISLQHLPISGLASYLHVPSPGTVNSFRQECSCMRSWEAEGSGCTIAMHNYLVSLLQTGASVKTVAQLTAFPEDRLSAISSSASPVKPSETLHPVSSKNDVIPELDSQKWLQLIRGDLNVRTQFVALNLLLQRIRREIDTSSGAEIGVCVKQLHQFFIRNKKLLKNEIHQMND